MNEISLKILDSPKVLEKPDEDDNACAVPENHNEVDPLAFDETERVKEDPLSVDCYVNPKEEPPLDLPVSCDDKITKDVSMEVENNEENIDLAIKAELIKEELLRDDNSPAISDIIETAENESEIKDKNVKVEKVDDIVSEQPVQLIESTEKEATTTTPSDGIKQDTSENELTKVDVIEPNKTDIVMTDITRDQKISTPTISCKPDNQIINGDSKKDIPVKRRFSEEVETESPLKKLSLEVEKVFPQHDSMINEYIQTTTKNSVDEIQRHTEQLLSEIQTLREMAQKKELEWNNILHLKKVKEEILLRLLRRKQVMSFEKSELNGSDRQDFFDFHNQPKNLAIDRSDEISGLAIKQPGSTMNPMMQAPVMPVSSHYNPLSGLPPPYDKAAHMHSIPKPVFPQPLMMSAPTMPGYPRDLNGQLSVNFAQAMGRQGPIKDVKSIIADYRQRHPDIAPRRGRRMKSLLNHNISMMNTPRPIAPKMDNLNNLGMIFNNLDMNQKAMLERLSQMQPGALPNGMSFKDVLVQFANIQQQQQNVALLGPRPPMENVMPNRPMEVHHPHRPTNDARNINRRQPERDRQMQHNETDMHISVKTCDRASPSTRLPPPPPYPEISLLPVTTVGQEHGPQQNSSLLHGILTKNCGEITITPVQSTSAPQQEQPAEKNTEEVVQLDDEESPASENEGEAEADADGETESGERRLVIDESATTSEASETPLCQGCRRRDAQFVCAGCANQWYCSRECQVAAWDDHSEMCSG